MDRRKLEIRSELQKLKNECQVTVELLNKLINVNANHIKEVENLDSRDFRLHSKYFLAVSEFQYLSHQKLLELNIELEQHLYDKNPPNLELFRSISGTGTPCPLSLKLSECSIHSPISSSTNEHTELTIKIDSNETNNLPLNTDQIDSHGNQTPLLSKSINSVYKDVEIPNKNDHIPKLVLHNTLLKCPSKNSLLDLGENNTESIEPEESTSSDNFYSLSNPNDTLSQIEGLKSDDSFYEEAFYKSDFEEQTLIDPKENNVMAQQPSKLSITERLKSLPMMSLEEKFMKSIPKAPMPNISLQPMRKNNLPDTNTQQPVKKEKTKLKKMPEKYHKTQGPPPGRIKDLELAEIKERVAPKVGDICMIGWIMDPSHFYIQVADGNSTFIDVWPTQLGDLYENSPPLYFSKTATKNKMGNFCCVKCDDIWYRAEVINWTPSDTTNADVVCVQLVDYGNRCLVKYTELRPLMHAFCHMPKMAQLCHLAYLHPPGSVQNRRLKQWPNESIETFHNMCGDLDSTIFKITHVYKYEGRNSYEVDLVNFEENEDENSLGQILIDGGYAVQIIDKGNEVMKNHTMVNQILTAHGIQGILPDMPKEEILDRFFEQNVDIEPQSVNEAVMHYNPRDEAETCRNLRPDGTCYKGSRCKLRHTPLQSGFTRDKEVVYQDALVDAPIPQTGSEIFLTISHIVNIQCFYAQLRYKNSLSTYGHTINTLIETMNNSDTKKQYKKLQQPPCLNQLLIAKHWNNYWYRAQIKAVHIPENNDEVIVEVYFVDFGDKLEVPMSELRAITSDFLHIPFQATECRLFNVKHNNQLDEDEEKRYFESIYLGQNFMAKIVAVPGHLEVLLQNDKGEDIGLKLIEDGYGELNTEHYFPRENEFLLID